MGGQEESITVTYPGSMVDPLNQAIQLNAGGKSVVVTDSLNVSAIREAVKKLKGLNAVMSEYYAMTFLHRIQDSLLLFAPDRTWVKELEKQWKI